MHVLKIWMQITQAAAAQQAIVANSVLLAGAA